MFQAKCDQFVRAKALVHAAVLPRRQGESAREERGLSTCRRLRGGAAGVVLAIMLVVATNAFAAGTFTTSAFTGDEDCGVSSARTYTHAYNLDGGAVSVNGVQFLGSTSGNPSGTNYSTSGFPNMHDFASHNVTGSIGATIDGFVYGGEAQEVTLTGLAVGRHYETTFYNAGYGEVDGRWLLIDTSDGGEFDADENMFGDGNGNMFKYDFIAEDTSLTFTYTPLQTNNTYHLYAFSNEWIDDSRLIFDGFDVPGITDRRDLNYNLADRQLGSLGTISYSAPTGSNVQLGNPILKNASDKLMLTWDTSVSPDHDFSGATADGGLEIRFQMAPDGVGGSDDSVTAGFTLGMSQADRFCDVDASATHFGMTFGAETGAFQAFDGSTLVGDAPGAALWTEADRQLHDFVIRLTDSTDDNPFDGVGQTDIEVLVDDVSVFTHSTVGGGYADNYFQLLASDVALADSFGVYSLAGGVTAVPEPSLFILILASMICAVLVRSRGTGWLLSVGLIVMLATTGVRAAGVFSTATFDGDEDCGISGETAYMIAVNLCHDGSATINDAVFSGAGSWYSNPKSNNATTSGFSSGYSGVSHNVTGNVGALVDQFLYSGGATATQELNLKNLRAGQEYVATFYNIAWDDNTAGEDRPSTITTTDGGSIHFDQDMSLYRSGNLLQYAFTAEASELAFNITPERQNDSFHFYGFSLEMVGLKALVSDNFDVHGTSDVHDLASSLNDRQGGTIGTVSYTAGAGSNVQVGNMVLEPEELGLHMLLYGDSVVSPDRNFNAATSRGGLLISFDMTPDALGGGNDMLAGINLGMSEADRHGAVGEAASHFGIRFDGEQGEFEAYDGATLIGVSGTTTPWESAAEDMPAMHHFELLLTDSTDDNPFDGSGQTEIEVFVDGVSVFTYAKTDGGYADNFLNFEANRLAVLDNLLIAQLNPSARQPGDLNDDGFVGGDDLDIVRSYWGQDVATGDWSLGDPSGDGFVGGDDLDIVRANWGQGTLPAVNAVPEPATLLGVVILLSAGMIGWRKNTYIP